MTIKQISVFLENQSGKLAELTACLSQKGINLRAISVAEASDFGIIRFIVDDIFNAVTVLKDADYVCTLTDVLAIEIKDEAGSLAKMISVLGANGINVEYMYAIAASKKDVAYMVVRVDDNKKAETVLKNSGLRTVSIEQL